MNTIVLLIAAFIGMFFVTCLASLTVRFVKKFTDDTTSKLLGFLMVLVGILATAYLLLPQ